MQPPQMQPPPRPQPEAFQPIDGFIPTNPLAAVACWTGVLSVILCVAGPVLGPIALITGVLSLKRGAIAHQSSYGKTTSTMRSWIGIVTGALGTLIGTAWIVVSVLHRK